MNSSTLVHALYKNIDIALFSAFLAVNLIIGLWSGRRVKNLRQYSIGHKDFSTATITTGIVVTWIGGGFMFYTLQNIYTSGLRFILIMMGNTLCLILTGKVLAIRMGEFLNNLSVAEAMRDLYGRKVQFVTAISGVCVAVGYIAIQFQVMAKTLSLLFDLEGTGITILAAMMAIFYSAFGGVRSVTITDIFQFIIFTIFIPIMGLIIWTSIKDSEQVVHTLTTNPIFDLRKTVGWNLDFFSAVALMLYFAIPGLKPSIFQRIAIAKDLKQVQASFISSAVLVTLIVLSVALVAILLLAHNPELDSSRLMNYLIDQYTYPGLKGIIAVGIIAKALSTADAELNASSVLIIHDIIKPLRTNFKESLLSIRIFSFLTGIFALILALKIKSLLRLMLWSGSMYMPIVSVPLVLAIFGFRSSSRAVLIGMAAGLAMVLIWTYLLPASYKEINSVIPGMIANIICFMGSHYLLREKGGWVGIKEPGPLLAARQARKDAWKTFIRAIKQPRPYAYLVKNLPSKEVIYFFFALYILGSTYACFYTIPAVVVAQYKQLYDPIAHSVLIAITMFLTYPAWPLSLKGERFIAFAWPLGMGYVLFVVGTVLVVMSGFHQVQVMLLILNLVISALLLDWPLVLVLFLGGILCAIGTFKHYIGYVPLGELSSGSEFRFIYGIPLVMSLLIAIMKSRQARKALEAQNAYLLSTNQESRSQLREILAYKNDLLKELNPQDAGLLDSTLSSMESHVIAYIQQAIYRVAGYLRLEVSQVKLDQLIQEVKASLKLQGLESVPQLIIKKSTQIQFIEADLAKIKQLLVEAIVYIQAHNPASKPITLGLEDATLGHQIDHMKDYTRKLDALKISISLENVLPPTDAIYMLDRSQPISQEVRDLAESIRIVDAHYGYADIQSSNTHVYVIPVNVREVRGKVMELLREPSVADPEELKHPLAVELEKKLLDGLQGTEVDLKVIKQALAVIKKYHGGVKRKSGEPFFTHPMAVALIVMDYSQDQDAIVAALLHDTVEDTSLSMAHIRAMFGETVAFLVGKATNLEDKLRRLSLRDHENIYRLMNYEDKRAALVKLADRLHNMRTIQWHSSLEKQQSIANETLLFFVPMADSLGLTAMAQELKELSLEVLGS